jgi:SAM-dependent methyltransferase
VYIPDYKDNPEAYEIEERSRPDEMLMLTTAGEIAVNILNTTHNANVLDLCCGTGLSLECIINHPSVSFIVGIDISNPYLEFAKKKYSKYKPQPVFIAGDAVTEPLPCDKWDLIILASAYHHIEDERKVKFLERVRDLLKDSGFAVIAENILPEYKEGDAEDYARAVKQFYAEVLTTAKQKNPNLHIYVEKLIQRVAQYGCDGDYEYKVSLPIFLRDLAKAGLRVVQQKRVWPEDSEKLSSNSGNFVLQICKE